MKLLHLILCLVLLTMHQFSSANISNIGDVLQIALPIGSGVYSLAINDNTGAKQLAYSSAITVASTTALKYVVNARRPNGDKHSFPSGHTSISFTASTYMWKRYGYKFGIPTTLLAGFVGYSRVQARRHYTRDVLAGAALGIIVSYFVTTEYSQNVSITPNSISINCRF